MRVEFAARGTVVVQVEQISELHSHHTGTYRAAPAPGCLRIRVNAGVAHGFIGGGQSKSM